MPVVFTNFIDGDVMTRAAVKTELDKARDYVNTGIVNPDILAASITDNHVFRPETYGFPIDGTIGTLGDVYGRTSAVDESSSFPRDTSISTQNWSTRRERESIFMNSLGEDAMSMVPESSVTFSVENDADVDIRYNFSISNIYDDTATTPPFYPDTAGYIRIASRNKATGVVTEYSFTQRDLYAQFISVGVRARRTNYETSLLQEFVVGDYDVFLRYTRNSASLDITQIVTSVTNVTVEVYRK